MREELRTEVCAGLSYSDDGGGFSFFLRGFLIDMEVGYFSLSFRGLKSEWLRITLDALTNGYPAY